MKEADTYQLAEELVTREGVEEYVVDPYDEFTLSVSGPARVLVIYD